MAGVEERVTEIIIEQLGIAKPEVVPEASFIDDLGADSLDVVEMVMTLEEAFEIEVPDADVETLRTIADVERYIAATVAA